MASTDVARGVWKSPAGTSATVAGIDAPPFQPTDAQMGQLNSAGLNAIVNLPAYGLVVWGARTLAGGATTMPSWRYLTTRRLADYIAHSLNQSLKWAIFEPNGPAVWSSLDTEITVFLNGLYLAGAFAGETAMQSFRVTGDATTTSAADIAAGLINIDVYFAAVRPADFVADPIQIGQTP
jgi:phage tail sheath protein FI